MKKLFFQTLILFFVAIFGNKIHAQTLVNREWEQLNGIPDSIAYSTSTLDMQGNLIVTSNAITAGQQANLLVMKYDRHGNLLWQDTYNGTFNGKDYGIAITTDNGNNIYVAGASQTSAFSSDFIIRKYKSDGTLVWTSNYSGSGIYNAPTAIALDNSGNVYVTGVTFSLTSQTDYATLKLNASGVQQWVQTYDYASLYDVPAGIEVNTSNGNVYVTGASASTSNNYDYATIEYDATNGTQLNVNRVTAPGTGFDKATAMKRDNAGNIYVTGQAFETNTNSYDIKTIKLNASLAVQWVQTYDKEGLEDAATTIDVDNTGNVYVGGYVSTNNEGKNFITMKYDASGTLLWEKEYNDYEHQQDDEVRKLTLDNAGNVTVTGESQRGTNTNFVTINYDSNGEIQWLEEFGGNNGDDTPTDIQRDNQGNVYVTGVSFDGTSDRNTVMKYNTMDLPIVYSYNGTGKPVFVKNQVIIRFRSDAVNTSTIDSDEFVYGSPSKFLTTAAFTQLQNALPFVLDRQIMVKIFRGLHSTDKQSVSRIGESVSIPDFWASFVLTLPVGTSEHTVLGILNTQSGIIQYAQLNYVGALTANPPIDNFYANQQASLHPTAAYASGNINVEPAWDVEPSMGKEFIKVGVFDDRVDWTHPEFCYDPANGLDSSKVRGWDFMLNMNLHNAPTSASTHGTGVAGIIGAWNNDNFGNYPFGGVAGIGGGDATTGNKGVSLYSMCIEGSFPITSPVVEAMVKGATYLPNSQYGYGLHIYSNSWRWELSSWSPDSMPLMRDAVHYANRNHVVFVAARGNDGWDNVAYPAVFNDDWVLCVSGFDENGNYDPGSSFGSGVDVSGPYSILTTYTTSNYLGAANPNSYQAFNGTSGATPHVSGTAGIMLSHANQVGNAYNNLVHEDVEYLVQASAVDDIINVGYDDFLGYGKLDAGAALFLIQEPFRHVRHFDTENFPSVKNATYVSTNNISLKENTKSNTGAFLPSGTYQADVYKITATVIHNLAPNENIYQNHYWTRPSSSNTIQQPDWASPFLDVFPYEKDYIQNINNNTAVVEGYAYHLYLGGNPFAWFPYDPTTQIDSFKLAYSILVEDLNAVGISQEELNSIREVRIYPNPSQNEQKIFYNATQAEEINITIFDVQGRKLQTIFTGNARKGSNIYPANISDLSSGVYFYQIAGEKGISYHKFIKN